MMYLNSPSTLRAPSLPACPARTEARAVLVVLLATKALLAQESRGLTGQHYLTARPMRIEGKKFVRVLASHWRHVCLTSHHGQTNDGPNRCQVVGEDAP